MSHCMIDLETLGVRPGSVILSIGAVEFSPEGLGRELYLVVNTQSCLDVGLATDKSTTSWWDGQGAEARRILVLAQNSLNSLPVALLSLSSFYHEIDAHQLWGNGADFDNALLAEAYRRCGLGPAPWQPAGSRCYRTLKNLAPQVKLARQGTFHNALDDAKSQALHAVALFKALNVPW